MKKKTAIKWAIECVKKIRQPYAIGANLHAGGIKSESNLKDSVIYKDLTEVINILKEIMKELDA